MVGTLPAKNMVNIIVINCIEVDNIDEELRLQWWSYPSPFAPALNCMPNQNVTIVSLLI
jgi:hypothetical protein